MIITVPPVSLVDTNPIEFVHFKFECRCKAIISGVVLNACQSKALKLTDASGDKRYVKVEENVKGECNFSVVGDGRR